MSEEQNISAPQNAIDAAESSAAGTPTLVLDRTTQARLDRATRDAVALHAKRDSLTAREDELTIKVAEAKGRMSLKGEMEEALEALQKMAHERSVGAFERMLTAIARDVQKGSQVEVKLDLTTERNMPALDIYTQIADRRESITSGAMANIVSTGLRFITLARSGRARFMILDEPDCFIESDDVQNFFNVVDQLSRDAGIQTLLITHHDVSAFEDRFRVYKVSEVDSNDAWPRRLPELVSAGRMEPSALQDRYFSFIEAENFESYTRAHIELSPGVTAITGKNGRGKSAWARVLRGLFLGESTDDNIRHGRVSMQTSVGYSDGRVLSHLRKLKGTPKGEFILHTPESFQYARDNPGSWKKDTAAPRPLHHTETARLPDWVPAETGVATVDGINVALWNQLTPVFMLDQPPSKQASLLSIGRESGHLYAMNEIYKDDVRNDNTAVREGEREIGAIRAATALMAPLDGVLETLDASKLEHDRLMDEAEALRGLSTLIDSMEQQQRELQALMALLEIAGHLKEDPTIERTEGLIAWFERMENALESVALKTDAKLSEPPTLALADEVLDLIIKFESAAADAALAGVTPTMPTLPSIEETAEAMHIISGIDQAAFDSRLPRLESSSAPALVSTADLSDLIAEIRRAEIDSHLPRIDLAPPSSAQSTKELQDLIEEFTRNNSLINSCRAQTEMLASESRELDAAIDRATQVLGAQWELPPDRIARLAEQVIHSTHGEPGADQRVVCYIEALKEKLDAVAKEGYAFGLTDGLDRAIGSKPEREQAANTHETPKVAA